LICLAFLTTVPLCSSTGQRDDSSQQVEAGDSSPCHDDRAARERPDHRVLARGRCLRQPDSPHQVLVSAKQTREDGAPTQAEIGPSLDFYLKPLLQLKARTVFDLDDSKKRLLVLSVGYRYLPSPDAPSQNRVLLMATSNVPMKGGALISDRNRLEINYPNGSPFWRYRNSSLCKGRLRSTLTIRRPMRPQSFTTTAATASGVQPLSMRAVSFRCAKKWNSVLITNTQTVPASALTNS